MGNRVSALHDETIDKQSKHIFYDNNDLQELKNEMSQNQKLMAMAIAQGQVALQVAATRERLGWFVPMLAASYAFLYKGYKITGSPVVTYPLLPMTFALFYQIDFAYGTKMNRVKDIADNIMSKESHLLTIPELKTSEIKTQRINDRKKSYFNNQGPRDYRYFF